MRLVAWAAAAAAVVAAADPPPGEGCGSGYTCVYDPALEVYGCAPLNDTSHVVCCSRGQSDCGATPVCPAAGVSGPGCVRFGAAGGCAASVTPCSQLLPHGTSSLQLNVSTNVSCRCAWSLTDVPFDKMTPFSGTGTEHSGNVAGLCADVSAATRVHIRCDADEGNLTTMLYRCLPSPEPPFPRKGNLWGWGNFREKGTDYAASHVDLWLGASWSPEQIGALRQKNPNTLVLNSINAVEYHDGLPERFYLHNASAAQERLESWPGAFRLDLTKPEVSKWKAQTMYDLILRGGYEGHPDPGANATLSFDGVFVDNVFLTQSWANRDIHGKPFHADTTGTGKPDDPQEFDRKWRAGVLLELDTFRQMMPHALMSGHAMDPNDPGIRPVFNAISIGFDTPRVIEGYQSFDTAFSRYNDWMHVPRTPRVTMVESAIPLQLGYGYGFGGAMAKNMPASTMNFSRGYYPYMRFGLTYTLMKDGYFAHEIGDSWHGQDWWYDELAFDLGSALGPAEHVAPVARPEAAVRISDAWQLWVSRTDGGNASLSWDTKQKRSQNASARVTVVGLPARGDDGVDLHLDGVTFAAHQAYNLSFWAKAEATRTVQLNSRRDHPDWMNYGLQTDVVVSEGWQQFSAFFTAPVDAVDGRLSFMLGGAVGTVWIDSVRLTKVSSANVLKREFEHGVAILNADTVGHCVPVNGTLSRLVGQQAPMHQSIVDDAGPAFSANGSWAVAQFAGGYDFSKPTQEEAAGPYFHHWAKGCHKATAAGAVAEWNLGITEQGRYSVKMWVARAPEQPSWATDVRVDLVGQDGVVVATSRVDQTKGGDEWTPAFTNAAVPAGTLLRATCASVPCVADALLVESAARYNDGGRVAGCVQVNAMDGIVLQRQ